VLYVSQSFTAAARAKMAHTAPIGERHPSRILITEVIAAYRREREHALARADLVAYSVPHLVEFWGDDYLSEVTGARCREYVRWRGKTGAARRDLETLRAAINHFHREYGLDTVPVVTLPPKSDPRQRWLTREEAARLLGASRGLPHLSRFIRLGLYTGTRSRALLGLSWLPSTHSGWVDLDAEIIYRRGDDQRQTKKQQTPHPIPSRLMPHLRRWHEADRRFGIRHVIHYQGQAVIKLRRSWATAREAAGLGDDVTPHVLRHTAATWLMQRGVDPWEAAKYLGMTVEMLERVYGHHHPDFLKGVKNAF
jgi:integrase